MRALSQDARLDPASTAAVQSRGLALVQAVRAARPSGSGLDAFLREYHLASREGVILMCLAEALLRIPDARHRRPADPRQDLRRRLGAASGRQRLAVCQRLDLGPDAHRPHRRMSTRAEVTSVAAGSHVSRADPASRSHAPRCARRCASSASSSSWAAHRRGAERARRAGRARATAIPSTCWARPRCTEADAARYLEKYRAAMRWPSARRRVARRPLTSRATSISVKLSALHPRYEFAQRERVMRELAPRADRARASLRARPASA